MIAKRWRCRCGVAHPGEAIRDYISWPNAEQRAYAVPV